MKSVYNEKRYLNGDVEAIKHFEQIRKTYKENIDKSLEDNKDIIKDYNIYLDYITEELLKYKLDTSVDYSIALGYLINKGYLSEGLKFDSKETDKEILGKPGISILQGSGCCRNICDMQKDIFERLKIDIIPFYCYQGFDFKQGINKEANHIINLIEYNNNLYGIDLYNGCGLYHFRDSFTMKRISSNSDELLRYKPYCELIIDGRSLEQIKERIELFDSYSLLKPINSFVFEMIIRNEIETLLYENRNELNEFNNKTKILRKNIVKKLDNI